MFNPVDQSMVEEPRAAGTHTRVKVCGITCLEDANLAAELGVDALGFNFYAKSARFLDIADDLAWLRELPSAVRRVAVVVNAEQWFIEHLLREALVDSVQLHGDEEAQFCAGLHTAEISFAKAIRVRDAGALQHPERFLTNDLLLDAYRPDAFGGTGHQVDWELAARFAREQAAQGRRVILSGGLTPENVAAGVRQVKPFAVDVASGVEKTGNSRRKDPFRLRAFIASVRQADGKM